MGCRWHRALVCQASFACSAQERKGKSMTEQSTVAAASSPAAETIELPRSGTSEYAEWRMTGEIPEKPQPKPAAPATADTDKGPTSDAGESETPRQQEHTSKGKNAESRIKELIAENKRLKAAQAEAPRSQAQPVQQQPQPQQYTRPKPTAEDKGQDGKPKYTTYEDFVEELADWKAEQRMAAQQWQQASQNQQRELNTKVEDARTRYENFDEVLQPTLTAIVSDQSVSPSVKAMLNDSEVLPDLIFTIGSDAKELQAFLKMARNEPGKALRYVAHVESLIQEELAQSSSSAARNGNGQFVKPTPTAPVKRGPESAPDPPLEVGSRGAGPMDE